MSRFRRPTVMSPSSTILSNTLNIRPTALTLIPLSGQWADRPDWIAMPSENQLVAGETSAICWSQLPQFPEVLISGRENFIPIEIAGGIGDLSVVNGRSHHDPV